MSDHRDPSPDSVNDVAAAERLGAAFEHARAELGKVVVGQQPVVEEMMIALFCGGHCILEGVPGLAKTLMISTLARTMELSFARIQFTPDLMPSDITGTEVIEEDKQTGQRSLRFVKGPVFANVILADEINRTPPKTQSALLEAMQERQVSTGGVSLKLPDPFFVLATQNPIEQEGTYPLPEAQLDRFMFKVLVNYPSEEEEFEIVRRTTTTMDTTVGRAIHDREILELQRVVRRVPCSDHVLRYAMALARWSRPRHADTPEFITSYVNWGAGPRGSQYLVLAGKARALLQGRFYVSTEDIRRVALPVLRHRIIMNFSAEAEGINSDQVVEMLLRDVPRDPSDTLDESLAARVFASKPQRAT